MVFFFIRRNFYYIDFNLSKLKNVDNSFLLDAWDCFDLVSVRESYNILMNSDPGIGS
jgi:hypothetical protein